ncbi:MAG: SpoIIE family protein phosphatase [Rhodospirillales bacterium]
MIVVLDPDAGDARQIAEWLRSAGLGRIFTARTVDEAIFMLGRQRVGLLIIDEFVTHTAERRLLRHIADCGSTPAPPLVRLLAADSPDPLAIGRAMAAEVIQKPFDAHDVVVRVGTAMQLPGLVGQMDRGRDQSAEHVAAARRMQLGLLPTTQQLGEMEASCHVGVAGFCRSGEAVGGDFWGAWPTGRGRFALTVADFAGHGLSAALNTFRLHAILSEQTLPRGTPARMMGLLNGRLYTLLPRGQYATMIYAQIDPASHRVAWCSAGGPPPMFVSAAGCQVLAGSGLPLGVRPGTVYRSRHIRLPEAGILCLFSDGLYEGGAGSADVPPQAIAAALAQPASLAAAGRLSEAGELGARALEALRDRYVCLDHSDDVMAICVALGPVAA